MRRIILTVIASVLGAAILIGGSVFAAAAHDYHTVHFDRYRTEFIYIVPDESTFTEEMRRQLETEKRIKFPQYYLHISNPEYKRNEFDPNPALAHCYDEVDCACLDYAEQVAYKYRNNADLDFTVDITEERLTVKFSGTGYPENGEPEALSRTYIFDIDRVGAEKLPQLVNREEFIGY